MKGEKQVLLFALSLAHASCIDTGQQDVAIPLWVSGSSTTNTVSSTGDWAIELEQAQVAFGPLYLCAGYQAGALCDTARVEWVESVVVDALDPAPHEAGQLTGVSGVVRSWMYDLGITSLLTQQRPEALSAANSLGGNSVRIAGVAVKGARRVPFAIAMPVQQEEATEIGVSVVRKSTTEVFEHEIRGDEQALTVRFDAAPWVREIDFESLVEDASCMATGAPRVCAGNVELTCDASGATIVQRDCGQTNQTCVRAQGCVERVSFSPESQGFRAVKAALVAGARPSFEWMFAEEKEKEP
jgi:hypothetical protein